MSDIEDSDDDYMPKLAVRNHEDSDSRDDEKEEEVMGPPRGPIARKKMVFINDSFKCFKGHTLDVKHLRMGSCL